VGDPAAGWHNPADDESVETLFRKVALPVALGGAFLVMHSPLRGLARVFLSMWVHELGHAVTAWWCGFGAFPGPWRTPVSDGRMALVSVVLAGGLGYFMVRAWRGEQRAAAGGLGALLLVQGVLTLGLRAEAARELIIFGGDGGLLVLGTALMLTFYVARGSALHQGWLRWGFVVIGAVAFADGFTTWWGYAHSPEGVELGENVGVGDSDPTVLVLQMGWTEARLISRYLTLGWLCLLVLGAAYLRGSGLRLPRRAPGSGGTGRAR
jgi:hypothetical protein